MVENFFVHNVSCLIGGIAIIILYVDFETLFCCYSRNSYIELTMCEDWFLEVDANN